MKNPKTTGWVFLLLFCIPFAGIGTGFGYAIASCLIKWQAMKSWIEVPAIIETTNLDIKHSRSSKGKSSTTYKVTVVYNYTIKDTSYTGDKVSMHSGSDNIGSFHKRTYDQLSKYKNSGEPFRVYVNPSNPSESILFRSPRLEKLGFYMIFTLIFGGFGYGLLYGAIRGIGTKRQEDQLKSLYQNEPWLWKNQWKDGIIHSQSKSKLMFSIIFALFWNLISTPILFIIPGELNKGNKPVLIALIFPFVGIILAIWAIRNILQWLKFGDSTFIMDIKPGVIGGPLKGKIHTKVNIKPENGFHLTLSCINRVRTRSGKNRHTHEYVRWQNECNIAHEMYEYDPSRSVIPVLFQIPYDCSQTNSDNPNNNILWRLKIKAKVPGVDYEATFEVPVFITNESSTDFVLDKSSIASYETPYNPEASLAQEGIILEYLPGGDKRFIFPRARNKGEMVSLLAFLLIWSGIVVLLWKYNAPFLFKIIFSLTNLFMIWAFLNMFFFHSRIEIYKNSITITKGLFFLSKKQSLDFSDIDSFKIKNSMSSGQKLYHSINVIAKDGQKILIAKNITNRRTAETIVQDIEKTLLA